MDQIVMSRTAVGGMNQMKSVFGSPVFAEKTR